MESLRLDGRRLSAGALATEFHLAPDPLRKKLERWRLSHMLNSGWSEIENRARNEARYVFRVGSVRHLLVALPLDEMADELSGLLLSPV